MKLSRITSFVSLFLAVVLSAPAFANAGANSALPGTVNYVEGQVSIGSQALDANSLGSAMLEPNQTLETGNGKAEILLTPGVFLRVDSDSTVRMISPSITDTEVQLEQGRAMVEVAEIHDQNNLRMSEGGVETRLVKKGLYEFDADRQEILVFDGKAEVLDRDRTVSVGGGKRVDLNTNADLKAQGFDKDDYKQSDLYQWSSLRSSYMAEANVNAASAYVADGSYGPGWIGAGWYWSPAFAGYTFIPGDGILYSPFGWGFYSPLVVYRSPLFVRFGGPRFVGPGFVGPRPGNFVPFRPGVRPLPGRTIVASPRPMVRPAPAVRGGFHSSGPAFHGGFHGGGGGHSSFNHR